MLTIVTAVMPATLSIHFAHERRSSPICFVSNSITGEARGVHPLGQLAWYIMLSRAAGELSRRYTTNPQKCSGNTPRSCLSAGSTYAPPPVTRNGPACYEALEILVHASKHMTAASPPAHRFHMSARLRAFHRRQERTNARTLPTQT